MAEAFPFVQVNLSNGNGGMSAELGGKPQGATPEPGLFDSLVAEYSARGESAEGAAAEYPTLEQAHSVLQGQGQPVVFSQPVLDLLASMKDDVMGELQMDAPEVLDLFEDLTGDILDRFSGCLSEESLDKLETLLSQIKSQIKDQMTSGETELPALRDKILQAGQEFSAELGPKATEGLKRQLVGLLTPAPVKGDMEVPELQLSHAQTMPMHPMEADVDGMNESPEGEWGEINDALGQAPISRGVRPLKSEHIKEDENLTEEEEGEDDTEGLVVGGMDRMASFAVPLEPAQTPETAGEGSEATDGLSAPVSNMGQTSRPERLDAPEQEAARATDTAQPHPVHMAVAQQGAQRAQARQDRSQTPSVTRVEAADASDEVQHLDKDQAASPSKTGAGREDMGQANLGGEEQPEGESSQGAGVRNAAVRGNVDRQRAVTNEGPQDAGDDRIAGATARTENSRADFQSFFEGVLNNRRTFSTEAAAPMDLRANAAGYDFTQAETLRDGLVNVVRFVRADGAQRANVIVDPPAIGRVTVELTSSTSGVEASIKVASEQVRQLVQEQITELRMTLAQQGVQVTQFAVDVQQDDGRRQQGSEQEGRRRRGERRVGRVEEAEDEPIEFRVDLEQGLLHWVA